MTVTPSLLNAEVWGQPFLIVRVGRNTARRNSNSQTADIKAVFKMLSTRATSIQPKSRDSDRTEILEISLDIRFPFVLTYRLEVREKLKSFIGEFWVIPLH